MLVKYMLNLVLFRFSAIVFRSGRGPPGAPPLTRALRCAPLRLAPLRRNLLALRVAQPVVGVGNGVVERAALCVQVVARREVERRLEVPLRVGAEQLELAPRRAVQQQVGLVAPRNLGEEIGADLVAPRAARVVQAVAVASLGVA